MKTHGMSKTRLFRIWAKMNARCSANGSYYKYGRRVCEEWSMQNDLGFENFRDWALKNGYSEELSIDRINNDGDYKPDNCRWTNQIVQANNKSTNVRFRYKDEYKTLSEYSREYGIPRYLLKGRVQKSGWTIEKAIETPIMREYYSFNGETHSIKEWAEIIGIPKKTLRDRIYRGYSFEDAITGNLKLKRG